MQIVSPFDAPRQRGGWWVQLTRAAMGCYNWRVGYSRRKKRGSIEPGTGAIVWERWIDANAEYDWDFTDLLEDPTDSWSAAAEEESSGVTLGTISLAGNTVTVPVTYGVGWLELKLTSTAGQIEYPVLKWVSPERVVVDAYR